MNLNGSRCFRDQCYYTVKNQRFSERKLPLSGPKIWLYDNSDQRRIRTENQIRTKDKFGPNFEIRPKLFR